MGIALGFPAIDTCTVEAARHFCIDGSCVNYLRKRKDL